MAFDPQASDKNISKLSESQVQELLSLVKNEFGDSEKILNNWKNKIVKYYELYNMVQSKKHYDGLANIFVPEILRAVETIVAKIYGMITGQPDWFQYEGRDNNMDEGPAIALTQLTKYQMDENSFKSRLMDAIRQMVIAGLCVRKVGWDYEEVEVTVPGQGEDGSQQPEVRRETVRDTWTLEPVNLLGFAISDIDIPYNDVQKARWIGEEFIASKNFIREKMRRGWFSRAHQDKLSQYGNSALSSQAQQLTDRKLLSSGFSNIDRKEKYAIKERWGLLEAAYVLEPEEMAQKQLEPDDLVETVLVICNDNCILKLEVNPFWHNRKPYLVCPYVPIEGQLPGMGVAQIGESLQEEINDTRNQTMDNKTLILCTMWLKSKGSGIANDTLKIKPNGVITTNDMQGLLPLRPPVVAGVGTNMEGIAKEDLRQSVGAASNLQGIAQQGVGTATESTQINRESIGRLLLTTELFCELLLKPLLVMTEYLNYQFYDHIKAIKICGPTGVRFRDLAPHEIAGVKNVIIKFAVDASENPAVMRQQYMNFLNILFAIPPQLLQVYYKALDKAYGMFFNGHKLSELLPAPVDPKDVLSPEDERDMVLAEQAVVASEGQDHEEYIRYHEQEFKSMQYALTPLQFELYKQLIMSHYQLLMIQMEQQRAMLMAQQMQMGQNQEQGKGGTDKRNPNTGPHTATSAPSTESMRKDIGG